MVLLTGRRRCSVAALEFVFVSVIDIVAAADSALPVPVLSAVGADCLRRRRRLRSFYGHAVIRRRRRRRTWPRGGG